MIKLLSLGRTVKDTRIFVERKNLPAQFHIWGIFFVLLQCFFTLEITGIFAQSQSAQELTQNAGLCFLMFSGFWIFQLFAKKILVLLEFSKMKILAVLIVWSVMLVFGGASYFFKTTLNWEYWLKLVIYSLILGLIFYYRLYYLRKIYLQLNSSV